jgi:hypothetical protein
MNEFIEQVAKMRELQKEYFRSRDSYTLQACKKSEREVDAFIQMNGNQTESTTIKEPEHPTLF